MADQTTTIPQGWQIKLLGEVVTLRQGKYIPNHNLSAVKNNTRIFPVFGGGGLRGFVDFFEYEKRQPIITCRGSGCGFVQKTDAKASITNSSIAFEVNNEFLTTEFIFYWALKGNFSDVITGSAQPQITIGALSTKPILIPPIPEQFIISAVLSSLDNKIDLLHEQNKTLEATAQAIFKEWFVNFKFPSASGKLIDSELGQIPDGWKIEKLGNIVNIVYGKNLPTTNLKADGFAVFGGNGQIGFFDKYLYKEQQVLVSCRGEASGKVNISLPNSFVTNNSLILEIIEKSTINFNFLKFFSLNTDYTIYISGSAQPQITIETIKYCPVLLPPKNILDLFNQVIDPFTKKNLLNLSQIKTLSNLRDALLPKLIKGEVRVKEFVK